MAEIEWNRVEDGLPDTPYRNYLVWWAHFENGYSGVADVLQFSAERMRFMTEGLSQWFDPTFHRITHWAEIPTPPGADVSPHSSCEEEQSE